MERGIALLVFAVWAVSAVWLATGTALADELVAPAGGDAASPPSREGMAPPWETVGKPPSEQPVAPVVPAQSAPPGAPVRTDPPGKPVARAQTPGGDSALGFFINVGAGFGYVAYDPYYQAIANSQIYSGGQGYPIASDLGIYWSLLGPNTLTGISGHAVTDIHPGSNSLGYATTTTNPFVIQGNASASLIHFFGPGGQASGFYVRADAGYAFVGIGSGVNVFSLTGNLSGVGVLGGMGYAFTLGQHVRLLLGGQATTILFLPDSPLSTFQGDFSLMFAF